MQENTETQNIILQLQSLPKNHILHSPCSYYRNFTSPVAETVKISEVLIAIDGKTYRKICNQSEYQFSSGMHQAWIGLYVNPENIGKKISEHKRRNSEYTAENEKNTISLMKKRNCGAVSTFTHIPVGAARSVENIDSITGVYPVDFDEIPPSDFDHIRAALQKDPYILFVFQSITRGRLKGGVILPKEIDAPRRYFSSMEKYFLDTYGLQIDKALKDPNRLMLGSYDTGLHVNFDALPFPTAEKDTAKKTINIVEMDRENYHTVNLDSSKNRTNTTPKKSTSKYDALLSLANITNAIDEQCKNIADSYEAWQRIAFAIANETGESGRDCFHRISSQSPKYDKQENDKFYDEALKSNDGSVTIGTVRHIAEQHGVKFSRAVSGVSNIVETKTHPHAFWRVVIDETGKKPDKFTIDYADFYDFLRGQGFARIQTRGLLTANGEHTEPLLCKIENGIAEETTPQKIREHIAMWLVKNAPQNLTKQLTRSDLLEYVNNRTTAKKDAKDSSLLSENHLHTNMLPIVIEQIRSDENTIRTAYANGVLELTANGMTMLPYSSTRMIMKSSILKTKTGELRAFRIPTTQEIETALSDENPFTRFVRCLSGHYKTGYENDAENRQQSIENVFGYMLHDYATTENRKMPVFVDIFDSKKYGVAFGGVGKSLILQALANMRKSLLLDGKTWDAESWKAWQGVAFSDRCILIDDADKDFKMRPLYSAISVGMPIEKKHAAPVRFAIGEHPRFCMASNYGVRSDGGDSDERRLWHVEIVRHFNKDYTPRDDKKIGNLFETWTASQWYDFDVYMAACCMQYLRQERHKATTPHVTRAALENEMSRKTHPCFVEEIESIIGSMTPKILSTEHARRFDFEFRTKDTCEKLSEACGFVVKPRTFNTWLHDYAEYQKKLGLYTFTQVKTSERVRTDYGQIRITTLILESVKK